MEQFSTKIGNFLKLKNIQVYNFSGSTSMTDPKPPFPGNQLPLLVSQSFDYWKLKFLKIESRKFLKIITNVSQSFDYKCARKFVASYFWKREKNSEFRENVTTKSQSNTSNVENSKQWFWILSFRGIISSNLWLKINTKSFASYHCEKNYATAASNLGELKPLSELFCRPTAT